MSQRSSWVCDLCETEFEDDTDFIPLILKHGTENEEDWVYLKSDICQYCWQVSPHMEAFWAAVIALAHQVKKDAHIVDRNDMLGLGHRDDDDRW